MTISTTDRPDGPAALRRILSPHDAPSSMVLRATLATLAGVSGRFADALKTATGFLSHSLASAHFVCGLDPRRFYDDYVGWRRAYRRLGPGLSVEIDPGCREVRAGLFGVASHTVRFRDLLGTVSVHPGFPGTRSPLDTLEPAPRQPGALRVPDGAAGRPVTPASERLATALNADPAGDSTKGVVVVRGGAVVAESYAEGYGPRTPIIGYSLTKALGNAIVGRMAELGMMSVEEDDLCDEWRGPGDRRRAIRLDHLLRMTSGLRLAETHSGFDPVSRMLFLAPDMGAFAARARLRAAPGRRYDYTCGNTLLLGRVIRDRLGGTAHDTWRFLDREILAPLGMERMLVEFDASGTPILSTFGYATARDWARLGLLYLQDGCVGSRRLLAQHWTAYSTTEGVEPSYGAGFRVNRGGAANRWSLAGVPEDAYFALGHLGQYIVVVPSRDIVVVRLGADRTDMRAKVAALVRLTLDASQA